MAPYYEYDIIAVTAEGYYFNYEDDSDRDIELWDEWNLRKEIHWREDLREENWIKWFVIVWFELRMDFFGEKIRKEDLIFIGNDFKYFEGWLFDFDFLMSVKC